MTEHLFPASLQTSACAIQEPFLSFRGKKRFLHSKERRQGEADRLAANAIPGPALRRPANGAAAEIACRLHLPSAAASRNSLDPSQKQGVLGQNTGRRYRKYAQLPATHIAVAP